MTQETVSRELIQGIHQAGSEEHFQVKFIAPNNGMHNGEALVRVWGPDSIVGCLGYVQPSDVILSVERVPYDAEATAKLVRYTLDGKRVG